MITATIIAVSAMAGFLLCAVLIVSRDLPVFKIVCAERDQAEALLNEATDRINRAKALSTPHMASIGKRMIRALDGEA